MQNPFSIAAIGHGAGEHSHAKVSAGVDRTHEPHGKPGPGERQHEERQCGCAGRVAGGGHTLADEERREIAVLPQRFVAGRLRAFSHSRRLAGGGIEAKTVTIVGSSQLTGP